MTWKSDRPFIIERKWTGGQEYVLLIQLGWHEFTRYETERERDSELKKLSKKKKDGWEWENKFEYRTQVQIKTQQELFDDDSDNSKN